MSYRARVTTFALRKDEQGQSERNFLKTESIEGIGCTWSSLRLQIREKQLIQNEIYHDLIPDLQGLTSRLLHRSQEP